MDGLMDVKLEKLKEWAIIFSYSIRQLDLSYIPTTLNTKLFYIVVEYTRFHHKRRFKKKKNK